MHEEDGPSRACPSDSRTVVVRCILCIYGLMVCSEQTNLEENSVKVLNIYFCIRNLHLQLKYATLNVPLCKL